MICNHKNRGKKMGNTHFDENNPDYEQNIVNSLYLMFATTHKGPNPLENFKLMIKQQPNMKKKQIDNSNLQHELSNIIKSLDYFEKSKVLVNIEVEKIFFVLEKIIKNMRPSDFTEEIFNNFITVINKLIVFFLRKNKSIQNEDTEVVILKYGDLIAAIHAVTIKKIGYFSDNLGERLKNNEQENSLINKKIVELENISRKQTETINKMELTIKSLSVRG